MLKNHVSCLSKFSHKIRKNKQKIVSRKYWGQKILIPKKNKLRKNAFMYHEFFMFLCLNTQILIIHSGKRKKVLRTWFPNKCFFSNKLESFLLCELFFKTTMMFSFMDIEHFIPTWVFKAATSRCSKRFSRS